MNITSRQKGFTLIELLVVIAIIGILSSVVLASLNSARDKGNDAAVKSNLSNIRAEAELYYDDNDRDYDGVCDDEEIDQMLTAASEASTGTADCDHSSSEWAAEAQLSTDDYFCVDSTGVAAERTNSKGADGTSCPAS